MNNKVFCLVILILVVKSIFCSKNVEKRALTYPPGAICGALVAVAIPLDLPNFNVFLSYNFEANYGLPSNASHYTQGPGWYRVQRSIKGPLYTRRNVYSWIENQLLLYFPEVNPTICLQRAICEHAENQFFKQHNGLFGDLLTIILSPSSSLGESFMEEYYEAETNGREKNCRPYVNHCEYNILDFISIFE